MVSRYNILGKSISYRTRLFLLLLAFSGLLTLCFLAFQYSREKQYKVMQINDRLQLLNVRIADALSAGMPPDTVFGRHRSDFEGLRLTIISPGGEVTYDSESSPAELSNHLSREEIREALASGTGYTIRRLSERNDQFYFYSALLEGEMIIRTALPYRLPLQEMLEADIHFLWIMLAVALLLSVAGYFATRRLGESIARLREFSRRLDRGISVGDVGPFPKDELGEVSSHIIRLYSRLQQASADLEREHARTLHQQLEKIRIKKRLTNNINHELKTPVSAIHGYLETVLRNPRMNPEQQRDFLSKCFAQTERLEQLLQDAALLTRMDEGGERIVREPVSINKILEEISSELACRPPERRLPLFFHPDKELAVTGNASLLHSVFRNLTENAIAYSGGTRIDVRILSESSKAYLFSFADDGAGVPEEHLPHLFERFYRVDKGRSRKLGGTGLGLSIVKNAVLFHGGNIEVQNRPGGGLEFVFSLNK